MTKIEILLFCLIALGLCGCQQKVMVRVANLSDVEMCDVIVEFPFQTEKYGNILPKNFTDYRRVNKAYRYAYMEATIGGKKAIIQPKDYTGERLLSGGNYTYALRYNLKATSRYGRLVLELKKE